jgi:hypothetical protein
MLVHAVGAIAVPDAGERSSERAYTRAAVGDAPMVLKAGE